MQSITLQGRFGVYYRLYLQANIIEGLRISPVKFTDIANTCQFIRGLKAMPSVWQVIAQHFNIPSAQQTNTFQLEQLIAKRLIKGQARVYALTLTSSQKVPKANRTLKNNDQEIEIALPQQLLNEGRTPNQAFTSASAAFDFISTLNPTTQQLSRLAQSLNITAPPNQHQAKIAQKLAAGDACIIVSTRANNTQLEQAPDQEAAAKPKPRTMGPQANKKPSAANQTQRNTDAEQGQAMQQAAQDGTPFCEECAAQA